MSKVIDEDNVVMVSRDRRSARATTNIAIKEVKGVGDGITL